MYIKYELQLYDQVKIKDEIGIVNFPLPGNNLLNLTQRQINKYFELVRVG